MAESQNHKLLTQKEKAIENIFWLVTSLVTLNMKLICLQHYSPHQDEDSTFFAAKTQQPDDALHLCLIFCPMYLRALHNKIKSTASVMKTMPS